MLFDKSIPGNWFNFNTNYFQMNIVITGVSKGIGYELVKRFCKDPANNVFGIARSTGKLEELNLEIKTEKGNGKFFPFVFDLLSDGLNSTLIPEITHKLGKVDVLINNAGLLIVKPFEEFSDEDFDAIFGVNVKAVFRLVRELVPYFNTNAHIVNISSMGGFQGSSKFPGLSLYSASKGALAVLSECLAEEFKERLIKVNSLAIGAVQTEMLAEAFPGYEAPLNPVEMAVFMADFAINGHKFYNGKVLPVSLSTP